jgi:hypothetical protein
MPIRRRTTLIVFLSAVIAVALILLFAHILLFPQFEEIERAEMVDYTTQ